MCYRKVKETIIAEFHKDEAQSPLVLKIYIYYGQYKNSSLGMSALYDILCQNVMSSLKNLIKTRGVRLVICKVG